METQPDVAPPAPANRTRKRRFRTIWVSDVHLGTRGCKARLLLDFLKHTESERLYLVGDILDGERLARSWYWLQSHNDVVQKLLRKARKGTDVVYVPGNHDRFVRAYAGLGFGGIRIEREAVHETADGRSFWVTHGDQCDTVVHGARWLSALGERAYQAAQLVSSLYNRYRRLAGKPYYPLALQLKGRIETMVDLLGGFRRRLVATARQRGLDGVICGHVHRPEIRDERGVLYCNDGDWVESCSALVEHPDGRLELLDWLAVRELCLFEAHLGSEKSSRARSSAGRRARAGSASTR